MEKAGHVRDQPFFMRDLAHLCMGEMDAPFLGPRDMVKDHLVRVQNKNVNERTSPSGKQCSLHNGDRRLRSLC